MGDDFDPAAFSVDDVNRVLDRDGKLVMQSVIATHATTILDFLQGLRGTLNLL